MVRTSEKRKKINQDDGLSLDKTKQKKFIEKLENIDSEEILKPGTIYIGHIPHGFYEEQMQEYFSQFGTVSKVRLARSKKTGGYKGYGYIQFASEDVAKIAAEAMDNYLMFDRLIKCEYISEEKLHPAVWKGANKKFVWCDRRKRHALIHNKKKDALAKKKLLKNSSKNDRQRKAKLLKLGINYEFPKLAKKIKQKKMKVKLKPSAQLADDGKITSEKKLKKASQSPSSIASTSKKTSKKKSKKVKIVK